MSNTTTLPTALRQTLPQDAAQACLVGRIWQPGVGPVLVAVAGPDLVDLSSVAPTSSQLLALEDPAAQVDPDVVRNYYGSAATVGESPPTCRS